MRMSLLVGTGTNAVLSLRTKQWYTKSRRRPHQAGYPQGAPLPWTGLSRSSMVGVPLAGTLRMSGGATMEASYMPVEEEVII